MTKTDSERIADLLLKASKVIPGYLSVEVINLIAEMAAMLCILDIKLEKLKEKIETASNGKKETNN